MVRAEPPETDVDHGRPAQAGDIESANSTAVEGNSDDYDDNSDNEGVSLLHNVQKQDSSIWERLQLPAPIVRGIQAIETWSQGPHPPQIQKIKPFFPRIQTAPLRLLDRFFPKRKHKVVLLVVYLSVWITTFVALVHRSNSAAEIEGYGRTVPIGCTASFWAKGNGCGLDGNNCRPFDNSSIAFKCPANCAKVMVVNPRAVGSQEIVYKPFIIGGPTGGGNGDVGNASNSYYRGDSFICQAAIHHGLVSNQRGGCGVATLVGARDAYTASRQNGLQSFPFDSSFPSSFSFLAGTASSCQDLRWPLLAVSLTFTSVLSLFTRTPGVFFAVIFVGIYFHVGFGSDPPSRGSNYAIMSILLGRFLPASFVALVFYRKFIRRTLKGLTAQFEKTILWLGGCWIGALTNYTFDFIPIQRLTGRDISQQPGAKLALVIIALGLLSIALGQIWCLRLEGRFPRMLALYLFFGVTLSLFVAIPGLNLRIHHYILALLLMPGTSMQTRPSLLYQGILVGFFINGIARWGFDPILQTPAALLGDGQLFTPLPSISIAAVSANNITLAWKRAFDGVSVLVNDVERSRSYRGYDPQEFTWSREPDDGKPYYFRFAYLKGRNAWDYTKAGVWEGDGSWTMMPDGPSLTVQDADKEAELGSEDAGRLRLRM